MSRLVRAYRRGTLLRVGMNRTDLMVVEKVLIDLKPCTPRVRRRKYVGHHLKGNVVARYHCEVSLASAGDKMIWKTEQETREF